MTMRTRGLFAYFGYELPLAQRLAWIARAGFTGTAMWWAGEEALVRAGRRAEMPAMVRDAGLIPLNAHLSFADCNDVWSPSRCVRESWLARRAADVEECARLDVPCAILHVTHGVDAPEPTGDGLDVLGRLVRQAEQAQVTLAVENTRRDDIVHRVLETFDSPAVGFCYDSSHDWMWGRPRGGTLRRWGARLVQTHLADCDAEGRDRHLLPGDWLSYIGFLNQRCLAAHSAWLTISEVRALAKAGASISSCPVSNMKLATGGVAPIPEMLREGVNVTIGTDGSTTNNSMDMFGEMKTLALLQKSSRWDPTVVKAQEALDFATVNAAKALGLEKEIGSIEAGKRADIVIMDSRSPTLRPLTLDNAVSNLVYSAGRGDVRSVICFGDIVVKDRIPQNLDLGKVIEDGQMAMAAISAKRR